MREGAKTHCCHRMAIRKDVGVLRLELLERCNSVSGSGKRHTFTVMHDNRVFHARPQLRSTVAGTTLDSDDIFYIDAAIMTLTSASRRVSDILYLKSSASTIVDYNDIFYMDEKPEAHL
jgi:hypothetical protein